MNYHFKVKVANLSMLIKEDKQIYTGMIIFPK